PVQPGWRGEEIGEMMIDAAVARTPARSPSRGARKVVGLYPGSRDYMVQLLMPFYAVIADRLAATHPDIEILIAKADFLSLDEFRDIRPIGRDFGLAAEVPRFETQGDAAWLVTKGGVRM